jgi:hypothetical protein
LESLLTKTASYKLLALAFPIALALVAICYSLFLSGQVADLIIPDLNFSDEESSIRALDFEGPTWNIWFDADVQWVYANMTYRDAAHWSLYKHPLFSITIWPFTKVAEHFTGDAMSAVRLIVAANAGISILLLWGLAARARFPLGDRALCCMLFLASSSMVFWYSVPERFPFGTTTLLVALHAAMSGPPRTVAGYVGHTLASIGTLSMTVTNWVAGLLATTVSYGLLVRPISTMSGWLRRGGFWKDAQGPLMISLTALSLAAVLALVQDSLFGGASLFFNVYHLFGESEYAADYELTPLWVRPFTILVNPILVGTLDTWLGGTKLIGDSILPSTWAGGAALVLWGAVLCVGLSNAARILSGSDPEHSRIRQLIAATVLTLAAFVALHSVYGLVTFLYAAHSLPYLLVLALFSLAGPWSGAMRFIMALLIAAASVNNLALFEQSVSFVKSIVLAE